MESVATKPALRDELRSRGLKHIEEFRWEQTAHATVDVYRSAVLRPSQRSLEARRLLRDAIIRWSEPRAAEAWSESYDELDVFMTNRPIGIKNAFRGIERLFAFASAARAKANSLCLGPTIGLRHPGGQGCMCTKVRQEWNELSAVGDSPGLP